MNKREQDPRKVKMSHLWRPAPLTDAELFQPAHDARQEEIDLIVAQAERAMDASAEARRKEAMLPFVMEIRRFTADHVNNLQGIAFSLEEERAAKAARRVASQKERAGWASRFGEFILHPKQTEEREEYTVLDRLDTGDRFGHEFRMRYHIKKVGKTKERIAFPDVYEHHLDGRQANYTVTLQDGAIDEVVSKLMLPQLSDKSPLTNAFTKLFTTDDAYPLVATEWTDLQHDPKVVFRTETGTDMTWRVGGRDTRCFRDGEYTFDPYDHLFKPQREEIYIDEYGKKRVEPLEFQAPDMPENAFLGMLLETLNHIPRV